MRQIEKNQEQTKAVARMQRYIDDNIMEKISMYELSRAAGYSPWHSARIFKEFTGETPFDYIRMLRLSKAAMILRDNDVKVIDVALDFVFDSHEGFSRAFSKNFGVSPKRYSKKTPPIKLFMPYSVLERRDIEKGAENMNEKKKDNTIFVQVIERPKRKLILRRGIKAKEYFAYCEEVGCDIWGILSSIKGALHEPMGLWLPENMIKKDTSVYAQGVEVPIDHEGELPEGCDVIELPACKMMIFQGPPFRDEDFGDAIDELQAAIKRYDPAIYGFEWADDLAPRFQFEPQGYRGYIEGRPVREIVGNKKQQ